MEISAGVFSDSSWQSQRFDRVFFHEVEIWPAVSRTEQRRGTWRVRMQGFSGYFTIARDIQDSDNAWNAEFFVDKQL